MQPYTAEQIGCILDDKYIYKLILCLNQRTNGPVNAYLISWPSKAQNIQNLEKYTVKK